MSAHLQINVEGLIELLRIETRASNPQFRARCEIFGEKRVISLIRWCYKSEKYSPPTCNPSWKKVILSYHLLVVQNEKCPPKRSRPSKCRLKDGFCRGGMRFPIHTFRKLTPTTEKAGGWKRGVRTTALRYNWFVRLHLVKSRFSQFCEKSEKYRHLGLKHCLSLRFFVLSPFLTGKFKITWISRKQRYILEHKTESKLNRLWKVLLCSTLLSTEDI